MFENERKKKDQVFHSLTLKGPRGKFEKLFKITENSSESYGVTIKMNARLFSLLFVFIASLFFSITMFPNPEAQIPTMLIKDTLKPKPIVDSGTNVGSTPSSEVDKLKSPRDTMATFLNAMEEVKARSSNSGYAYNEAIKTLDLSQVKETLRGPFGRLAAERLINTLDRIAVIKLARIPNYSDGPKWVLRKQTLMEGDRAYDVEIAIEKNADGAWRFSTQTVQSIDLLYATVAKQNVLKGTTELTNWRTNLKAAMPKWMGNEIFIFKNGQWIGFIAIFILSLFVLSLIRILLAFYAKKQVRLEFLPTTGDDFYRRTLPFGLLAFSLTWMWLFRFLELDISTFAFLWRAFYILIAITSVWSTLNVVDYIALHFEKRAQESNNKFDDVLVPMLKKSTKVVVVGLGLILIAHSLTFDVASILAGLGIGGVAIALAAKDTISNLFGSVTVIMDRPFLIGDYVILDKGGLEGTVEEVGFRSTRLRTPHQSIVSLPNNVLANMAIDNYGMRGSRRFKTMLCIEYGTPLDKLEEFCERLRYVCKIHQFVDPSTAQVYVHEMTDNSVNILFNVFFNTKDGNIELTERHKMIIEILKIAEELGVKFATPPQLMVTTKEISVP